MAFIFPEKKLCIMQKQKRAYFAQWLRISDTLQINEAPLHVIMLQRYISHIFI